MQVRILVFFDNPGH